MFPCIIAAHIHQEYENDPVLVPISNGEDLGKELKCDVVEVNTHSGENVNELFNKLIQRIMKDGKNGGQDSEQNRNCQIQ